MLTNAKLKPNAKVISHSIEVMSGAPVFVGTRVPVVTLIDYLAGGHSMDEFLYDFPTVKREQALELLRRIKQLLQDVQVW